MKKFIKDVVFDTHISVFSFLTACMLAGLALRTVNNDLLTFSTFVLVLICGSFIEEYVSSDKAKPALVWGLIISITLAIFL